MNNKGFTLIELLATVAILAIIGGVATYGVINTINNSRLKSEKIFVDKLSNLIDEYLALNRPTRVDSSTYTFTKCQNNTCSNSYQATATKVIKTSGESIHLKDLVDDGIIDDAQLINPKNKQKCLTGDGPEIKIYKDSDFVYYFYVDLTGANTTCDISTENGIIDTLPEKLKSEVGNLS